MTFLKIILPLGWLVGAWYCWSLCRCLGMSRRHVIWVVCSIDCWRWIKQWLEMDDGYTNGASTYTTIYLLHWHRVPTSYPLTVPAAHEPGTRSSSTTTSTVVWPSPRTSCGPVAQHFATEPRLRPSFFVHRERRRFFLRPAAEPMTYSGRPPRPRPHRYSFFAVRSRDASSLLTHAERHHSNNYV